jgi:hypothetical protein
MPGMGASEMLRLLVRRPALAVWAAYIAAAPFYLVHNGLPQPGDLLIVVLVPVALGGWNGKLIRSSARVLRPLIWFTAWVCLVDATWCLAIGNFTLDLLFPLYYTYNALIVLSALVLHQRYGDDFLRVTLYSVYAAVLFQVAASFVMRGGNGRNTLFFYNPNQLGYYALLAACTIALTYRRVGFGAMRASIGITGCAYLAVISASRSAVSGIALLAVLLVFSNVRVLIGATVIAAALAMAGGPLERATDSLQARIAEKSNTKLDFWEQRGYDRIWHNKEYVLLGAGEGANWRFRESTAIGIAEIHSSAGTLLFCYGIVGVVLFGMFMWRLVEGAAFRSTLMFVPPGLYALAHQGLRFTSLWILVAAFIALKSSSGPRHA